MSNLFYMSSTKNTPKTSKTSWKRACYIHIINVPDDNTELNRIFSDYNYEEFITEPFDDNITQNEEAKKVLKKLHMISTLCSKKALEKWNSYDIPENLSPTMRKIMIRYEPIEILNIPTYLIRKLTANEVDMLNDIADRAEKKFVREQQKLKQKLAQKRLHEINQQLIDLQLEKDILQGIVGGIV